MKSSRVLTASLSLFILTLAGISYADNDNAVSISSLRDIKPPVDFPSNFFLFYWLLGILAVVTLIFLLPLLLKKLKKKKDEVPLRQSASDIAYERLEELKSKNLPSQGETKEHYICLSDIIRRYIEDRFTIRAPEMTTQEFLSSLKDSYGLKVAHKELLREFLVSCDMVKFARYGPTASEIEKSFGFAKRFIDETKEAPSVSEGEQV